MFEALNVVKDENDRLWLIIEYKQGEEGHVYGLNLAEENACMYDITDKKLELYRQNTDMVITSRAVSILYEQFAAIFSVIQLEKAKTGKSDSELLVSYFNHALEEVGEIGRCFNFRNDEPLHNECLDLAICSIALMVVTWGDFGGPSMLDCFERKMNKWEARITNDNTTTG